MLFEDLRLLQLRECAVHSLSWQVSNPVSEGFCSDVMTALPSDMHHRGTA